MPRTLTVPERTEFLAQPHVAVLSVAAEDRPPLSVPVWYGYRPGGDLTFYTGTAGRTARKTRLLEAAGAFTLNVQRAEPPYRYVTVECTVIDTDRTPSVAAVAAITRRYLPEEHAMAFATAETAAPDSPFVLFTGRPEHWISGDFAD